MKAIKKFLASQYNNQGQAFNYQTTRELAVPGYSQEKIDDTTWKTRSNSSH